MKSLYPLVSRVQNVSNVKLSESLATNPTENLLKKFILRSAGVVALFLFLGGSVKGQVTIWSDNFDASTTSWTVAGNFAVDAPGANNVVTAPRSSAKILATVINGTYANNCTEAANYAVSPVINCSSYSSVSLKYYSYSIFETCCDYGRVYYSIDNGSTWLASIEQVGSTVESAYTLHTVSLPSASFASQVKIKFTMYSDVSTRKTGWNIDDLSVEGTLASVCSGTPAPGNTTSTTASVSPGGTVTLGLQNATTGTGVTYQWQSSTTSSTSGFSDVSGATNSSYAATVNQTTWYRCNATCSGNTGTSTAIQVQVNYCFPTASTTTYFITGVSTTNGVSNFSNTGTSFGLSSGYSNYSSSISCSQIAGNTINIAVALAGNSVSNTYSYGVAVWVDWNNNLLFETSERMYNSAAYIYSVASSFTIPVGTLPGNYRMRVLADYNATNPSPCAVTSNTSGECEDYTLTVVSPSISTSSSITSFTTCYGSASTAQSFTVSGTNLGASLVVTAPTGFEVSTTQNGTYTSSVSFTPSSGTVSSQTVWARLSATATGTPSGNIVCSSTGATTQNIAVSGTVNSVPTAVTVTGGAICNGGSITASGGTGGTIYWQGTTSNGTSTSLGSGSTSPAISSAGTYYARSQSAEGCWGTQGSASVTFTPIPTCIGAGFIPADASNSVNPVSGTTISWSAVSDATSYDVYFGTDNAPTNIANGLNQSGLSFATGSLTENTTYYWKVVPKNCNGSASDCAIYSFTTTTSCTPPTISSTSNVNINCFNQSTGSITVNATGGVTGYEYSNDNGTTWQSSNVFGSLAAGAYTIVVKGGDGCVGAPSIVTLIQPAAALSVSASGSGSGCGGSTLSLSSNVTGGTSPYTYSWSNAGGLSSSSAANPTATISSYASHTLTVTDANGCTASSSVTITNNSPAAPTVVTPDAICQGQSANLNATSSGNGINWYSTSTGGIVLNTSTLASGVNYVVTPASTLTYYAEATSVVNAGSQTFDYSGSIVNWTVPVGVTSINVDARGAQGGVQIESNVFAPGNGARIVGTISVTPGDVLKILVGGKPADAASDEGAGGGGGSFLATSANVPLVVAGGGGGEGADGSGANASLTQNGTTANAGTGGTGGNGGSSGAVASTSGSGGGGFNGDGTGACTNGQGLSFVNGGNGGVLCGGTGSVGGFGGGGGGSSEGGGGGGGYSGGGGSNNTGTDGGGGGGSYSVVTPSLSAATQTGNGQIIISWNAVAGCSSTRTPVTVTVNEAPTATAGAALSAICQGQTSAVMGGSIGGTATSGTWSGGDGTWTNANDHANATYTASASESGTISLTLTPTGVGSCPSVVATKTIVVNANPSVSLSSTPNSLCNGSSSQLSVVQDVLQTTFAGGNGCSGGNMFNITTNSKSISINGFTIYPNSTGAQTVSIYYKTGSYVGSETVSGNWTLAGTYPITSTANSQYYLQTTPINIPAGTTYGIYIYYSANYTSLASITTYSDNNITLTSGAGLCGLFSSSNSPRGFNGKVHYQENLTMLWSPSNSLNSSTIYNPVASPTSTTLYSLLVSSSAGCSANATTTVTVNQPSVAPTAITGTTTICNGSNTTLTANGTLGTGASYEWGTGSTVGTNPIAGETTASITVSPTSTITYWVRITGTTSPCTVTTSGTTTTVIVNQPSVAPTSISGTTTICNGASTTLSAVGATLGTGATYEWGTGSTVGSSPIAGTGSSITVTPTATTSYWVRVTGTTSPCATTTDGVTTSVTVNALPTAVTVSGGGAICAGTSATLTADNGSSGTIYWQNTTSGGTSTATASASQSVSAAGTYYFRPQSAEGCWGTEGSATVTVTSLPSTPVVTVVDNCNGTSTLSTTATGTLLWSTTETTSPIAVSTADTYTVTQTVNGCTSASGSAVAAPKTTPVTPSVSVTNDCGLSTLVFTPAENATILWSNNATTASTTTSSNTTLSVVQTVNGCPSSAGSGSAVPLVIPSAPVAAAAQNFCVTDNATVASLAYTNVAGNTYTWYDAATAGNTVATSTQLPTATTNYYLSATGSNGCTSTTRTAVAATESEQALATVSITGTSTCPGGEITFTATPSNGGNSPTYQWYNGGVPILNATGNTYIATGLAEGAVITVKMIPSGSCVTVCPN